MMDKIDFNNSEQCTLDIRLTSEGLVFGVSNPLPREGCPSLEVAHRAVDETLPLAANLKKAFDEWEWLHRPFRRVNVLMVTGRFTLVPLDLFDEGQAEAVFYQNHPRVENERVLYNVADNTKVVVLFGIDKSVCAVVDGQYAQARYYAQASLLMEHFSIQSRLGNTRKMFAHLCPQGMDVFCYDHGRLLLANSYKCRVTPDRLYYLLYVWQTLGFEQERDELHLCGLLDDKEALLGGLRDFIRQVFVITPATDIDLRAVLDWED